jgi:hypothetical protein
MKEKLEEFDSIDNSIKHYERIKQELGTKSNSSFIIMNQDQTESKIGSP